MALVIDTGPLYALFDRRDVDYLRCRELLETSPDDLVVPTPVLVEVDQLLGRRNQQAAFNVLLEDIAAGKFRLIDMTSEDYARARAILEQYTDFDIGFVDAAVLAIVERLNEPKLATLDRRHFSVLRPRHVEALELLP